MVKKETVAQNITMTVEKIGPKKAAEYLKKNINNPRGKKMNRGRIVSYAEDMKNGRWQLNGEAIVFDSEGFLKNGQHRLAAILAAGVEVEMTVIRGVDPDITIFDLPFVRTVAQVADCDPTVSAAANIIVNDFQPSRGRGNAAQYIVDNRSELERAYRITCYGNGPKTKSKCAPCVAGTYLALRTQSIPSYTLELFFRIFNSKGNCRSDGYDPSPAIVARRMFDERGSFSSGYQLSKEKLEIIVMALQDFQENVHREEHYKIAEPFHFQEWMKDVRRKDGLEK